MNGTSALRQGTVTAFDQHVGLGVVTAESGESYEFHCTQIADGTRAIAVDTPVHFVIVPRHKGRHEAYSITSL